MSKEDLQLYTKVAELNARTIIIADDLRDVKKDIKELRNKLETELKEKDKTINELISTVERHKTYFKIFGAGLSALVLIITALIFRLF